MAVVDSEIERILVVVAHPDDADFGVSGSMARWTKEGIAVTLLCVTRGEQGAQPDADIAKIPAIREAEQRAASARLGVHDVRFLEGHPDGTVTASLDLVKEITRVIRQVRPNRIVTQSPERNYDRIFGSHPDHLAAGEATVQAAYPACENVWAFPDLLADGLDAWKVREVWVMAHPTPDHAMDITDFFDAKLNALLEHSSQTGHRDDLDTLLRGWGTMMAQRFELPEGHLAEVFKVITING